MDENSKKKMCWNCEGNISLEEDVCPYCRASIIPHHHDNFDASEEDEQESEDADEGTLVATTLALLMGGTFFFLFGCLLYFFSDGEYFVLRWSNAYWFIYLLIALPMIYFGLRNLRQIPDEKP
jgi:hypothetical protein